MGEKTVCLTMIVKDEAHIISGLLESIYNIIDYWVIVDTGSTDGTQKLISSFFAERSVPGELHEKPWINFGHNRTEAMDLADGKSDYMWVIDADDKVNGILDFSKIGDKDSYCLKYGNNTSFMHWRSQLFRSGLKWRYIGVVHEYAHSDVARTSGKLAGDYFIEGRHLGARSKDPNKYEKDAIVLENALQLEPDNARYWFYLAQSHFSAGNYMASRHSYQRRVEMGGWPEETFYAQFRVGLCEMKLEAPEKDILNSFLAAFNMRPCRAEPLWALAEYFRKKDKYAIAYLFAKPASEIPLPANDILFLHTDVYTYRALDELGISAFYCGHKEEGAAACIKALAQDIPEADRLRIAKNLSFYEK